MKSRVPAPLHIGCHAIAAHRDAKWRTRLVERGEKIPAIVIRKSDVAEEHIVARPSGRHFRLDRRARDRHGMPIMLEMPVNISQGVLVIFHEQNVE